MSDEYDILIELSADDMKKAADEREHRDAEITRLRERLAEADEANRRVSDENEKLRFERDTIGEANYVNGWNDAINSSEAMQDLRKALLYVYDNSLGLDPDKIADDIEWVTAEIRAARKALETEK